MNGKTEQGGNLSLFHALRSLCLGAAAPDHKKLIYKPLEQTIYK